MTRTTVQANREYARRIDRVIDYLRENLDRPVKLDELAGVARFSAFHFHRVFGAVTGETVNAFTNRLRLEKAARLLRYSNRSATDIALDCGFSSPATFSRAFRAGFGTTPSRFRATGAIDNRKIRKALYEPNEYLLPMTREQQRMAFPVRMRDLPARTVAYLRVTNAFEAGRVSAALAKMVAWGTVHGQLPQAMLFGMSADDPHVTPKHLYRYEVCLATTGPVPRADGMSRVTMPAMRYATTRVSGDLRKVATAWDYLYRGWLVHSAYEPEHAPALEIFLDPQHATDWSHLELELCVPVRKLEASEERKGLS